MMDSITVLSIQVWLVIAYCSFCSPQLSYTHISLPFQPGQVDTWTVQSTGCSCQGSSLDLSCACCAKGGCNCDMSNKHRCVQCGLESSCGNVCNITLSSQDIIERSGRSTGELKPSADLRGPTFCWFRFAGSSDERVEIHIYRILRIGIYDPVHSRCAGGGMMFSRTVDSVADFSTAFICGENERFSPPLVLFHDIHESNTPVLMLKIDGPTDRSQFLAHYSFTKKNSKLTGQKNKGGKNVVNTDCDVEYSDCEGGGCRIASPGHPGVYPQNLECRYYIGKHNTKIRVWIKLLKLNLPRGSRSCESNYLAIYKGGEEVDQLCGDGDVTEFELESDGSRIYMLFRTGAVVSPFLYNGFLAEVQTKPAVPDSTVENRRELVHASQRENPPPPPPPPTVQSTDSKPGFINDGYVLKSMINPEREVRVFGCNEEVQGERERVGKVSSTPNLFHMNKCSIVFRGAERDVLLIKFTKLELRDGSCASTSLKISVQDPQSQSGVRVVQEICAGNKVDRPRFPLVVNSSLVFLDFKTEDKSRNSFQGAFKFQNVLTDGHPQSNSSCDIRILGDFFPFLPKLQGIISTPNDLDIFGVNQNSVDCDYSLETGANQSFILSISSSSPSQSSPLCLTGCDGTGCRCNTRSKMSEIDYIQIYSSTDRELGCLCGNFQKILPVIYRSDKKLKLKYHHSAKNQSYYSLDDRLKFSAQYKFTKSSSVSCGKTNFSDKKGVIYRPVLKSAHLPFFEDCEYIIQPPPHRLMHLEVVPPPSATVSCGDWEMNLWTEIRNQPSRNKDTSSVKQSEQSREYGRVKENVGRLCGGSRHTSFSIVDMFRKELHIRVSSISLHRAGFKVTWVSDSPIPIDIINNRKQELDGMTDRLADKITNGSTDMTVPLVNCVLLLLITIIL